MTAVRALLVDRRRRQRGSVLSGVLIIVAMLAILVGALMTQLSSAFQLSRIAATRIATEATVNSAVELAINNLHSGPVPAVCVRDGRGPWQMTLNGKSAFVTQTCTAIVPDVATSLNAGNYSADGFHESVSGINDYVVGDQTGWLRAYQFGTTNLQWSRNTGGAITAPAFAMPDGPGHVSLLVPNSSSRSTCGGHCVTLYDQQSGTPSFQCDMAAGGSVNAAPAAEVSPPGGFTPNFPGYAYFGDASGRLSVYDAGTSGTCQRQAETDQLQGPVVGQPLVFTGTGPTKKDPETVADIFVVTSNGSTTWLEHWEYSELADGTNRLVSVESPVTLGIGGQAVVSAPNLPVPNLGSSVSQLVAGHSGSLIVIRINASSSKMGPTYSISTGASGSVPASVSSAPYWCHSCPPSGTDLIGVGSTNHVLYLLSTSLATKWTYTAPAIINTTPAADANGEWYFGADDGYVYDVEIPASGSTMFNAARFGPISQITSSPIEGACGTGSCLYFASTTFGYFVQLGSTRTSDLRACISSGPGSLTCAANPRLWARATVGGTGVSVQGWSYYSPP